MWQNPSGYNAWAGGQQNCVYLEFVESYENIDGSDPTIDREKVAQYYTWTLDELWGKKDPRFKASIYTQGTPWTHEGASVTLDYHVGIFVDGQWINDGFYEGVPALGVCANNWRPTPFGILKYLDESSAMIPERYYSKTDWIVFRLGEIYLNFAEAAFELNKPDSALWAVNKIRARAGMPELQSITREQIRHERKIELAFEGNRYWTYAAGGPPYKTSRTLGTACATSSTGQRRNTMSRSSTTSAERPNPISTRCTTTGLSHKAEPNRIRTCCPTIRAGGNTLSLFCSLLRAADVAAAVFLLTYIPKRHEKYHTSRSVALRRSAWFRL